MVRRGIPLGGSVQQLGQSGVEQRLQGVGGGDQGGDGRTGVGDRLGGILLRVDVGRGLCGTGRPAMSAWRS
ncbi:hypothetical protein [Streptomyces sp. NBC_01187]|uniref:hypothetical protein n=1 Tax=Streptomyces sp. NBC_01187 TaxID=2903766 RepID=UPI00386CB7B0|nr:hypothetical protein OG220_00055 [Streptomyces sp. NBC_01187]WSS46028.1 hypothetical protein OG220_39585 [Streptomyces sp. NBC_01187]